MLDKSREVSYSVGMKFSTTESEPAMGVGKGIHLTAENDEEAEFLRHFTEQISEAERTVGNRFDYCYFNLDGRPSLRMAINLRPKESNFYENLSAYLK